MILEKNKTALERIVKVSGVAHEINTPLGVSLSTLSYIKSINDQAIDSLNKGSMTKDNLKNYFIEIDEGMEILENNLNRSADLVQSFKQVSIDQRADYPDTIDLKNYIEMIIKSLKHEYKAGNHKVEVISDGTFNIKTYPGAISQILSNLMINSINHGFKDKTNGLIKISLEEDNDDIKLIYKDNGSGIKDEHKPKIFNMFYTTNKSGGGSGLGLNIVYNLVMFKLKGKLDFYSEYKKGVTFIIRIPKNG